MTETKRARPRNVPVIVEYEKGHRYAVPYDIPHWLAEVFYALGAAYVVFEKKRKRK